MKFVLNCKMDFRYGEDWFDFLKERCFEELIDDIKLFYFKNLNEKVIELKDKILIKYYLMYEFKY